MDDDDINALLRRSVRQALERSPEEIGAALADFGWREFALTDEAAAFTALFEEQGHLAADTDALDLAAALVSGIDADVAVIWPLRARTTAADGDGDRLRVEGIALRSLRDTDPRVLVPAGGRLLEVTVASLDEHELGGMARGSRWVEVRGDASASRDVGSWSEVDRRCRLALASELVGVSQRMLDVASEQVSTRRQFGRPVGRYQAVRFRLAEAYAEVAGARALVAAAWEDGSADAARWAKAVAGSAHDATAKHATQVCGAIGLSEEHPLPGLVRRGFALDALLGSVSSAWPDGVEAPVPVSSF